MAPTPAPATPNNYSVADIKKAFGNKVPKDTKDILPKFGYDSDATKNVSEMRQDGYSSPTDSIPQKPGKDVTDEQRAQFATDMVNWAEWNIDKQTGLPKGPAWDSIDPKALDLDQTRLDLRRLYGTADLSKIKNNPEAWKKLSDNPTDIARFKAVRTFATRVKGLGKDAANTEFAKAIKDGTKEIAQEIAEDWTFDSIVDKAGLGSQ